jgi:hypothetical protein
MEARHLPWVVIARFFAEQQKFALLFYRFGFVP